MRSNRPIIIQTGSASYPVVFGGFRREMNRYLGEADKVVIVSNPTVYALHSTSLPRDFFPARCPVIPLMIGDGERYKTRRTVNLIYDQLFDIGLQRHDLIVAFGGGVVGDTAGFAAATYKRGVNLIHVPTTLLSMVDSSVGGKAAVNHPRGKNLIGVFYQPRAVMINTAWLATLGTREMTEGLAEIIKTGFLSSEKMLKAAVSTEPDYATANHARLMGLIRETIEFKAGIVARDERDLGLRAILNFGHTFGHAIEKAEGYNKYRHGEAVLAGMAGALYLSHIAGKLTKMRLRDYLEYLAPFMSRLRPLKMTAEDYVRPMAVDKKGRGGQLHFVLLDRIGRPVVREVPSRAKVLESVDMLIALVNKRGER